MVPMGHWCSIDRCMCVKRSRPRRCRAIRRCSSLEAILCRGRWRIPRRRSRLYCKKAWWYVNSRMACRRARINFRCLRRMRRRMWLPMTILDLRGRDLIIIPVAEWLQRPTAELLEHLFGAHLPAKVRAEMGRDKRQHFLRTRPLHFSAVKHALQQQRTPFTVAFDERPALPFATSPGMQPRPYQAEALSRWLAQGGAGVVVLPTGAGKTFVAALAIHEMKLWTLVVVPTIDLLQQ